MSPELDNTLNSIQDTIKSLKTITEKEYGKGSNLITTFNDDACVVDEQDVISTGSVSLDYALGVGGYLKGRIIELFGSPSSGKSTACLHAIANAQKKGNLCLFCDAEHSLDKNYAKSLGVDFDKLIISQPDYGEQALQIVDWAIKTGKIGLIIVDSVAALVPKAELEGEMEDQQVGLQARMMSKAMRKITASAYKNNVLVIFVNQTRANIGYGAIGNITSGGNALKFHSSMRVEFTRIGSTSSGSKYDSKGNKTRARTVKNKLAPPFKEVDFPITFGIGIDRIEELVNLATEDKIILKGGAWYTYNEEKFQGTDNMKQYLNNNPEVADKIEKEIRANRGLD